MNSFEDELRGLINKYSEETASNTPDFILARFMCECLHAYNEALQARTEWFEERR